MSVTEEDLPARNHVRGKFRELEDSALAQRLQDEEYDKYYNQNVQMRRTAGEDYRLAHRVAQKLQQQESQEEEERQARQRQDQDIAATMQSDELRMEEELRKRQQEDLKVAAEIQDEEVAWRVQEHEDKKLAKMRQRKEQQERRDAELARQASLADEEAALKLEQERQKMEELSMREAQRLQQLAEEHERAEELSLKTAQRLQEEEEWAKREAERRKEEEDEMSLREIQRMRGKAGATQGAGGPPSYDQLVHDQEYARQMQKREVAAYKSEKKKRMQSLEEPPPVIEYEQPLRRGGEGRQGTQSMYVRAPQHPPSDPRAARMDQSFGRDPPRHHQSPSDVFSSFPRAEHPSPDVRHRATMPPQYSEVVEANGSGPVPTALPGTKRKKDKKGKK